MRRLVALIVACGLLADAAFALNIRAVRLQAPATNVTQDYTITSFGTVQAAIIISAQAGDGADGNFLSQTIGFYDGTNSRVMIAHSDHGVTPNTGAIETNEPRTDFVIKSDENLADGTYRSATAAFITDGVRLTWGDFNSGLAIRPWTVVILINGINGAVVGGLTPAATNGGTATASSLGITPKIIFGIQNRRNFGDAAAGWRQISFGFAYDNGSTYDQYSVGWNNINASDNEAQIVTNRIAQEWDSGIIGTTQEVTDMASGSFTITNRAGNSTSGADHDLGYLALDLDESAELFESTVPTTDVAWTPYSSGSVTPQATIMIATHMDASDTEYDSVANAGFYGLYFASASEEFGFGWAEEQAADPTNTSGRSDTLLLIQDHTGGTPDFTATSPTFSAGQIQYSAANAGEATTAWKVMGIAFAEASSGIVPITVDHARRRRQ